MAHNWNSFRLWKQANNIGITIRQSKRYTTSYTTPSVTLHATHLATTRPNCLEALKAQAPEGPNVPTPPTPVHVVLVHVDKLVKIGVAVEERVESGHELDRHICDTCVQHP
jgi:hypothetical protein